MAAQFKEGDRVRFIKDTGGWAEIGDTGTMALDPLPAYDGQLAVQVDFKGHMGAFGGLYFGGSNMSLDGAIEHLQAPDPEEI
jgi:hypothetical protein